MQTMTSTKSTNSPMQSIQNKLHKMRPRSTPLSSEVSEVSIAASSSYHPHPSQQKKKLLTRKKPANKSQGAHSIPPSVPKSEKSRRLIYNAIRNNDLFHGCTFDELQDFIDAFREVRHVRNSVIVREGDPADGFYALSAGTVSVYEAKEFKRTLYAGHAFGEIAMLYSHSNPKSHRSASPRTATVKAWEDCHLWFMDRMAYHAITTRHERRRLTMKLALLEKVLIHGKPLGTLLKPHELHSLALAARFREYSQGTVIVRQGEVGNAFYMIERGRVDVYVRETSEGLPVSTLGAGDVFGERALLTTTSAATHGSDGTNNVRTATCVASGRGGDVRCVVLTRDDFVKMLDDCEIVLWAKAKSKSKEIARESNSGSSSSKESGSSPPSGSRRRPGRARGAPARLGSSLTALPSSIANLL